MDRHAPSFRDASTRRPPRRRRAGIALLGVLAFGAWPAAPCPASPARPAAQAHEKPWRDAVVAALQARGDAHALATAALLADGPLELDLANRATALAPQDAAVAWVALRLCAQSPGCDLRGDATELRWLDPGNGAAWLPVIDSGMRDGDEVETDRALAHMAKSSGFDFYWNRIVVMMVDALAKAADDVRAGPIDSDANRLALAERIAAARVVPRLASLLEACRGAKAGGARHSACETVARLLEAGDTISAQLTGIAIDQRYARAEGRKFRSLGERRRVLEWRVETAAGFDKPLLPWLRNAHARWRIARMRSLARQEDVIMAVLREHGMPLDPPPPPPPPTPPPAPPEPLHLKLP